MLLSITAAASAYWAGEARVELPRAVTRLVPWWRKNGFATSCWAFTFAAAALPICLLNFVKCGEGGVYERLAVGTFAAANVIIGAIFIGTVWLLVRGKLFSIPLGVTQDVKKAGETDITSD